LLGHREFLFSNKILIYPLLPLYNSNSTQSIFITVTVRLQLQLQYRYKRSRNSWNKTSKL